MTDNARRSARLRGLTLVALAATLGLAACGGSRSPAVANLGTTTTGNTGSNTTTTGTSGRGAPETPAQLQQSALKFSQCMRSHGVPNFPDPGPSGGFVFPVGSGLSPSSPALQSAQTKCQTKYMAGAGPPGPGTVEHPAAQWLAQMVKAAACMRRHGYPDFPDPRTSVPSNPFGGSGARVVSDIDGVIFLFPGSTDTQSPRFYRAADACKFPDHHH